MTDPQTEKWRDEFLRLAELPGQDQAALRSLFATEFYKKTQELVSKRIPARFASALPSHPEVLNWMYRLVHAAFRDAGYRPHATLGQGRSVLLAGPTGRGKTHEALGVIRGFAACGLRMKWEYVTEADYYALLRPRHKVDSEDVFERFATPAFLVFDDLGAAKVSEWTEEAVSRLVDYRYRNGLPGVFATNLLTEEPERKPGNENVTELRTVSRVLGDRVASRLAEMAEVVLMTGRNRRRDAP